MYTDDESGGGRYKTSFMLMVAKKLTEEGKTVLYIDMETEILDKKLLNEENMIWIPANKNDDQCIANFSKENFNE